MTDPLRQAIRGIFEKHTMPEAGDPELLMFDTDAIISDIAALLDRATVEARIDELEQCHADAMAVHVDRHIRHIKNRLDTLKAGTPGKEDS